MSQTISTVEPTEADIARVAHIVTTPQWDSASTNGTAEDDAWIGRALSAGTAFPRALVDGDEGFNDPRVLLAGVAGAGAGGPNGTGAIMYALMRLASGQSLIRPGDLRSTGLAPMATVNAIACSELCVALPDPGGNGLGATVGDPPR